MAVRVGGELETSVGSEAYPDTVAGLMKALNATFNPAAKSWLLRNLVHFAAVPGRAGQTAYAGSTAEKWFRRNDDGTISLGTPRGRVEGIKQSVVDRINAVYASFESNGIGHKALPTLEAAYGWGANPSDREAARALLRRVSGEAETDDVLSGIRKPRTIGNLGKRPSLGAAPGDVDGFVRETTEAVQLHAERAFDRAGLTVAGKPLGARARERFVDLDVAENGVRDGGRVFPDIVFYSGAGERFEGLVRYAWFARQFVRGATGQGPLGGNGWVFRADPTAELERVGIQDLGSEFQTPEARLGLDLWRLGRNVAREVEQFGRTSGAIDPRTLDRILESVRTRLNWPRVDFDPPPPSQWPSDD